MLLSDALHDLADVVLGRACVGCGVVGRDFCDACLKACQRPAVLLPVPRAATNAWAGSPYAGTVRTLVLAYKDGQRSLARPLAVLLADVVAAILASQGKSAGFLVRVPGHRRPERGFDALGLIVRHAVIDLHRRGLVVPALRILAREHDYPAAKNLTRPARLRELDGAFVARPSPGDLGLPKRLPVIVVDDVMTSGATLAEAIRALRFAGFEPDCAAVIAAAGLDTPGSARVGRRGAANPLGP